MSHGVCISEKPRDGHPSALEDTVVLGCVSYLNSKPLIHGMEDTSGASVHYDVPSGLLRGLETGAVDMALCPVIDYHRSAVPLEIVPVGGIGCDGPTLTVRLFSQVPIERIHAVHADTDSHTSVALLQVVLNRLYGIRPRLIDWPSDDTKPGGGQPEALLLIGDKVVTDSPPEDQYPHGLDLGQAWRNLTGLPFVFATWMTPAGTDLGEIPDKLKNQVETNLRHTDQIAEHYAPAHGWPLDLAQRYLGEILQYRIGPRQMQAIAQFARFAAEDGVIAWSKAMVIHQPG